MKIYILFLISVCFGFALDLFFGDPAKIPHPVVLIGKAISQFEKIYRKIFPKTKYGEIFAGAALAVTVPLISFVLSGAILYLTYKINIILFLALNTFWTFQILCCGTLNNMSYDIYKSLQKDDIQTTRKKMGMLVGRDTSNLNPEEIIKADIETVAENTSDGITAPLFWLFLLGVPGGFLYKAVNTLDSMVGYRNEKYEYFGKVSAISDDVFNFIPSRICALLMILASPFCRLSFKNAFKIFIKDRYSHLSPNSAQTESVAAGALGLLLGGTHVYFGKTVIKPKIGENLKKAEPSDILKMNRLMIITSLFSLIFFEIIYFTIFILFF